MKAEPNLTVGSGEAKHA